MSNRVTDPKTGQSTPLKVVPRPNEPLDILADILSGALPLREVPAFLLYVTPRPITLTCAIVAVVGTVALLLTR